MTFVWVLTLICTLASGVVTLLTMAGANSAPQEAAGYAMACAISVVPYVFAKAGESIINASKRDSTDRIVEAIVEARKK